MNGWHLFLTESRVSHLIFCELSVVVVTGPVCTAQYMYIIDKVRSTAIMYPVRW